MTGSLQKKNGKYYAVLNFKDKEGKRKQKWISTGLEVKNNKRKRERYHASFYTIDELNKLFTVIKGTQIETPVLFAAYYGLRRSEILGLKWESIDFDNKTISICNKIIRGKDDNGKLSAISQDKMKSETSRRILPLCDTISEYLTQLLEKQQENVSIMGNCYNHKYDGFICVNAKGDIINPDYVTDAFSKLLKKNGLRHIRFHDLRHSCASLLVSMGYSMKDVQEWLGHADYTLTANTYSHVDMSEKVKMANSVNEKFTF